MLADRPGVWTKGAVRVERVGGTLWVESDGQGLLLNAPDGIGVALGRRRQRLRSVLLTSGRLEQVGGMVGLLAGLERGPESPLVVRFPVTDERAALLVEAWQRGWGSYPVTLDAVGPGAALDIGRAELQVEALSDAPEPPPLGLRLLWGGATLGFLPRCRPDGAASKVARGCDLLAVELGGLLGAGDAVKLAGDADLWLLGAVPSGLT